MVRTQVQLTDAQLQKLRELSKSTGKSIADLVRQSVESFVNGQLLVSRADRARRALKMAGKFSSGLTEVSQNHDRYLADAFQA